MKMKTLTRIAAIALAVSAIAACGKDDGPENGGDNKVTERPESIMKPLADAGYVLTEVSVDDGQRYTFEYDKNDQYVKFSNGKLTYTYDSEEGVFKSEDSRLSLNSSGFADVGNGMTDRLYFSRQVAMENSYEDATRYRWKEDDITKITATYYGKDMMKSLTYAYTYSRRLNNFKMWTYAVFMPCLSVGGSFFTTSFLGFHGLLGLGTERLPETVKYSETLTYDNGTTYTYSNEYTFTYELSDDGRILKEIRENIQGDKLTVTYTYGPSSKSK